jgi:hypothetical protein
MEDGGWSYDPRGVKALSKALGEQEKEMQRWVEGLGSREGFREQEKEMQRWVEGLGSRVWGVESRRGRWGDG